MELHSKLETHWEMGKLTNNLAIGDLVRLCVSSEESEEDPAADWMYGLYMGHTVDNEGCEYGWIPRPLHKILWEGKAIKIDHFWHIERITNEEQK